MSDLERVLLAIFGGALTLAIVSVILSPQAQTTSVVGAISNMISSIISAATSPVTGRGAVASSGGSGFGSGSSLSGALNSLNNFDSTAVNFLGGLN